MIRRRFLAAPLRAIAAASLLATAFVAAAAPTLLDHAPAAQTPPLVLPDSVFHDWQQAETEAQRIVADWTTQPLTVPWTRLQLERHVRHKAMPTRGARGLALVHVAMYDAYQLAQAQSLEPRLVVSMAAAQVLAYLFPAEERAFDRIAFAVAARLSQSPRDQLPEAAKQALALGQKVGRRVIARGESDGAQRGWSGARLQWFGEGRYYGPGSWEPTPPYFYYPPDEPFAPLWKPWILERADQFRPKPPAYWSAKLLADTREVVEINRNLTPDQLRIA